MKKALILPKSAIWFTIIANGFLIKIRQKISITNESKIRHKPMYD